MEKIFTPKEACKLLKTGRTRFYQLLKMGEIEHYKNGNRYLITESALIKFIDLKTAQIQEKGEQ